MNQQLIRYRTKPEHAARNEELIRAVYAELHQTRPDGLRYAAFKLSDGVTFLHLGPSRDELLPIGSYRVFDA